jgi:RNA polymerase sigma factor (sigma-70 family)
MMKDKTDKELFRGIASGDQECWAELIRRYANLIYLVSLRILNNNSDAEDAVQNVFIKIQNYAHRTNEIESAVNWIKTIATREALLILRQRRSQERIKNYVSKNFQESDMNENKNAEESHTYLLGLINNLPNKLKTTLSLHYFAEMSYEEIGQKMNVDKSTISRWVEKGIASINQKLKKEGVIASATVLILSATERLKNSQVDAKITTKLIEKKFKLNNAANAKAPFLTSRRLIIYSSIIISLITLALFMLHGASSQIIPQRNLQVDLNSSKVYFSYCKNNKWGVKTPDGKIILEAKYEMIDRTRPFKDGLCRARLNGKWGFINEKGEVVIPFQYELANFFANGVAWVLDTEGWIINTKNEKLFGPFKGAASSYHNLIYVRTYEDKDIFLNLKGEKIEKFNAFKYFIGFTTDGAALAKKENEVGIVYADGTFKPIEILKDLDRSSILMSDFKNGFCLINLKGRVVIFNHKGEIVIDNIATTTIPNEFNAHGIGTRNGLLGNGHYITQQNNQYELRKIPSNEIVKTFSSSKKLVIFEMNSNFINLIWADSDSEILSLSK